VRDARATTRATSVTVRGGDGRCVGVGSIMGKGHGGEHGKGSWARRRESLPIIMTPRRRGAKPERGQNCEL